MPLAQALDHGLARDRAVEHADAAHVHVHRPALGLDRRRSEGESGSATAARAYGAATRGV